MIWFSRHISKFIVVAVIYTTDAEIELNLSPHHKFFSSTVYYVVVGLFKSVSSLDRFNIPL